MEPHQVQVGVYPYMVPRPVVEIPKPRDHVVWSLLSTLYMNCCCLGFAALVFSFKSRDCKVIGDPEGASRNSRKAKYLNIAALIMTVMFFIMFITIIATTGRFLHPHLQRFVDNFHKSETEPFIPP